GPAEAGRGDRVPDVTTHTLHSTGRCRRPPGSLGDCDSAPASRPYDQRRGTPGPPALTAVGQLPADTRVGPGQDRVAPGVDRLLRRRRAGRLRPGAVPADPQGPALPRLPPRGADARL